MRKNDGASTPAGDGDGDKQIVELGGQTVHPFRDQVLHRLRHRIFAARGETAGRHRPLATSMIRLERPLREHRLEQLDGVQWVSSGDTVNSSGQAPPTRRGGHVAQLSDHLPDLLFGEGEELDRFRMGLGPDDPAESRSGRIAFDLAQRHRAKPQHRRLLEPPDEIAEQPAGIVVAPLQIVDGEDYRTLCRDCEEKLRNALEQTPAVGGVGRAIRLGQRGESLVQLR